VSNVHYAVGASGAASSAAVGCGVATGIVAAFRCRPWRPFLFFRLLPSKASGPLFGELISSEIGTVEGAVSGGRIIFSRLCLSWHFSQCDFL